MRAALATICRIAAWKQKSFDEGSVDRSRLLSGTRQPTIGGDASDADESAGEKVLVGCKSTLAPSHPVQKQRPRLAIWSATKPPP